MHGTLTTPGKHSRLWKEWRRAGKGKGDSFFMEHREAVLESLETENPPAQVLLARSLYSQDEGFWGELASRTPVRWYLLEDDALNQLLSVKACSGLCGLYSPSGPEFSELKKVSFILVAWEVQDPGNLGTIIRSCSGLAGGAVLAVGAAIPGLPRSPGRLPGRSFELRYCSCPQSRESKR